MSKTKTITRIFLIAAVIAMLAVTAYAADLLHVKSLMTGTSDSYSSYSKVKKAMRQAGFEIDIRENFDAGYAFELIRVQEIDAMDENNHKLFSYNELAVHYRNGDGNRLVLCAYQDREDLPVTEHADGITKEIGSVDASYWQDHYKFVPDDYEPTDEDKAWMEQPGNFISYGSDEITEQNPGFLEWEKNGVCYFFMDMRGQVPAETLFAMAEELILAK